VPDSFDEKQPTRYYAGVRALFIIACVCLVAALVFIIAGAAGETGRPIEVGTWGMLALQGNFAVYSNHTIRFSFPLEVIAVPFSLPSAVWAILASRRRRRVRGFPVGQEKV
jgi:hypothetical protein